MKRLWVVYRAYDYEGCGPPLGVFSSEKAAQAAMARMKNSPYSTIDVEELVLDAEPEKEN